jgi:threonine dehydrogenase-like Zn-dependent dehydrogenase
VASRPERVEKKTTDPQDCLAVTVQPGVAQSARLDRIAVDAPGPGEVLMQVVRVGVCGTDAEICAGTYGAAPAGSERLVLGHESLLRVVRPATDVHGWSPGDLAVGIVRRPCPDPCPACQAGRWDLCMTGRFAERGISRLDGFLRELLTEQAAFLVPVPPALEPVAVLVEPLSVVEKALEEALRTQGHPEWSPRAALVTGAGPIGLLAALALRQRGYSVWVVDRQPPDAPKARLVQAAGMRYVDDRSEPLEQTVPPGGFGLAVEATGYSPLFFRAAGVLGRNGVLVLTGVTSGHHPVTVDADALNAETVLENHVLVGSVNAARRHYQAAVADLMDWHDRFPGLAERLITAHHPLRGFQDALAKGPADIKSVIEVAGGGA